MRYNIVAGEALKKILTGRITDPIPFNEDLSVGTCDAVPFTEPFFEQRSDTHCVTVEAYKQNFSEFLNILPRLSPDDEVHLYFGEDKTCVANRKFLLDYLQGRVGKTVLHIVDEYTGDELR